MSLFGHGNSQGYFVKLQVRNLDGVFFIPLDQNEENLVSFRDLLYKAVDCLGSTERLSSC